MVEDPACEDLELRGRHIEADALLLQMLKQGRNARIDLVLVQAYIAVALAIETHGLLHLFRSTQELRKAREYRRADHPGQRIRVRNRAPQFVQGILDRAGDA